MARLNVNPTRMELSKLKKRLAMSRRGHKLLKDKRDEMMKQFLSLARENRRLRREVEQEFLAVRNDFSKVLGEMPAKDLEAALMLPCRRVSIFERTKNLLSVEVPEFELTEEAEGTLFPYGFLDTVPALDFSILAFSRLFPKLVTLAGLEQTVLLLSFEIEKTRRRVNALEYVIIPDLEETIRYIAMKLEENERGNITRLMKVKELMVKERLEKA